MPDGRWVAIITTLRTSYSSSGGVSCLLQVNWLTPVKIRSLAVSGSKGYAELDYVTQRVDFYAGQKLRETGSGTPTCVGTASGRPWRSRLISRSRLLRELAGFVRAARGDEGEIVSGYEAMKSLDSSILSFGWPTPTREAVESSCSSRPYQIAA